MIGICKMIGHTKWYSKEKGFGFATLNNGEKDIFIHRSQLEKARITMLEPGDKIEFETEEGSKGPQAINIRLVGGCQ